MQPGVQSVRLSMAQFILIIGAAALTSETSGIGGETRCILPHAQDQIVVLQGIISACIAITNARSGALFGPDSPLPTCAPLATVCVRTLLRTESYRCPFQVTCRGLALKLLAILQEFPVAMESIQPHDQAKLGKLCLDIVLQRAEWIDQLRDESTSMNLPQLRSEEDAFDVLCSLPEATFNQALREAFEDCITQNELSDQAFRLLEPLLWLSTINPQIRVVHRVLHRSGTCEFLSKIVFHPVPPGSYTENRDIWRAKGDAITCIGNIMERMDRFDFSHQITKELIASVKAIKDDEATPLAQKNQALYMLQRYTASADHCCVAAYHREPASQGRGLAYY
ncbi:hypothetical protein FRC01_008638 [Tulasnella sp. 417]|nr:hypothetical protein FRC01_008638 [Tulasnella sp. 417]